MDTWTDKDGNEYMLAVGGYLYKRVYDPDGEDNPDDIEIGHVHKLEALRQQLQAAEAGNVQLRLELEPLRQQFEDWASQNREYHQRAKVAEAERARLAAELETARDDARLAAHWMNQYGNIVNWPPDMPMEYAEAINKLRAVAAQPRQPDADEAVAGTA